MYGLASSYRKANRMNGTARWSFQLQNTAPFSKLRFSTSVRCTPISCDLMDSERIVGKPEVTWLRQNWLLVYRFTKSFTD